MTSTDRASRLLGARLSRRLLGSEGSTFATRAAVMFMIGVATRFVRFPTNIAIARTIGADEFGRWTYAGSWISLVSLVAASGVPSMLLRFVSQYAALGDWPRLRGLLVRSNQLVLLTSGLAAVVTIGVLLVLRPRLDDSLFGALVIGAATMPVSMFAHLRWNLMHAVNWVAVSRINEFAEPVLVVLFLGGLLLLGFHTIDAPGLMGISFAVAVVMAAVAYFGGKRAVPAPARTATPRYETRQWLRVAFPLFMVSAMQSVLGQADVLIVGLLLGPTEAGLYAVATRIANFSSFGLIAANLVAQPQIAEAYALRDQARLQRITSMTVWISTVSTAALAVPLLLGHRFLLDLFGAEFGEAAPVTFILIVVLITDAFTGPIGSLLNLTGHQDRYALILGTTGVLAVALNVPAVLAFGMNGAALATGTGYTARNIWTWIEVRRRLGVNSSIFGTRPVWRRGSEA